MPQTGEYYWIEFKGDAEELELASWRLFEAGAPAIEELESERNTVRLKVSHSNRELIDRLAKTLPHWEQQRGSAPDQDWDLWWREQQHPIEVTPKLRVLPPWVKSEPIAGVFDLTIEAKMAFGTGHHETTRLAAQLIENHLPGVVQKKRPPLLLDIGTGTGILAMYAAHLGAETIGTEIDPVTMECLAENWRNNGLGEARAILGPLSALRRKPQFDLIIANMIRSEVWPLRCEILELLACGGIFIISGQLVAEKEIVLEWFERDSLRLIEERSEGEWWAAAAAYQKLES